MNEDADEYEPGFQYQDFINLEGTKLISPTSTGYQLPFRFQPYSPDGDYIEKILSSSRKFIL